MLDRSSWKLCKIPISTIPKCHELKRRNPYSSEEASCTLQERNRKDRHIPLPSELPDNSQHLQRTERRDLGFAILNRSKVELIKIEQYLDIRTVHLPIRVFRSVFPENYFIHSTNESTYRTHCTPRVWQPIRFQIHKDEDQRSTIQATIYQPQFQTF